MTHDSNHEIKPQQGSLIYKRMNGEVPDYLKYLIVRNLDIHTR